MGSDRFGEMDMSLSDTASHQIEVERLSFLRKVPLFASLADKELRMISRGLRTLEVSRGDVVCKEGEVGDSFYIIRSGVVTVSTRKDHQERILNQLYRGDFFGEASLLTGEVRAASVTALLDVDLFVLPKESFEEILRGYPLVSLHLNRILCHRLKKTVSTAPAMLSPFLFTAIGSEKGVGTSTFVGEVASILSSEIKKRVLVVDFEGGRLNAGAEFTRAMVPDPQLLEDFDSPYKEVIERSWFKHASGFVIFLFPSAGDIRLVALIGGKLSSILGVLQRNFDYVIFDLPPFLPGVSRRALRLSDRVLYLLSNGPEGVKSAKEKLGQIRAIVGHSPSVIQVGVSHLVGTSGLHRSSIREVLGVPEVPEVWMERKEVRQKDVAKRRMSGPRRVARGIGGGRIGLALGSGGARGWAHVGVLEALEKEGIPIDMIAGTSIGALVGATYAKTMSAGETYRLTVGKFPDRMSTKRRIYDYTVPRRGFIKGAKILRMLREGLEDADFMDLTIPVAVVAVDIGSGEEVVVDKDSVSDAVRASIAIPGVIEPLRLGGKWLVDGGLLNPVPADVLIRKGMDFVIGVCLENRRPRLEWDERKGPNIINILTRSFDLIRSHASRGVSEVLSVGIYPPVDDFRWDDFHRGDELARIGRESTYAVMDKIKGLLP